MMDRRSADLRVVNHLPASRFTLLLMLASLLLSACQPDFVSASSSPGNIEPVAAVQEPAGAVQATEAAPTPFPTRPPYPPGEMVDYTAQTGDTLPALAVHFNTSVQEILAANPFIPPGATTLPPGMPMNIPIYYLPYWGNPYQILPDSLFVNGPAQVGFDVEAFVASHPGWLARYVGYVSGANRSGAQIVSLAAQNYGVSPRLLLALLEYQAGALSQPEIPEELETYPLGYIERRHPGVYLQLGWAANKLNNGYYGWRKGTFTTFELLDGRIEQPDPWQNAATVAIQLYFSTLFQPEEYQNAISPDGFIQTYQALFGDPWLNEEPHIPGSLAQPAFLLPFQPGKTWAYTGGPHTGWGLGEPLAAIDFAPPSVIGGCTKSGEWTTAMASGVVARSQEGIVVVDVDPAPDQPADGDERTGWIIFYLHIATEDRIPAGMVVQAGDPIGHPSCEGGSSTGTHVHIARKYNGEWILADGPLAFNMEGWISKDGPAPYLGTLTRFGHTITACECSDNRSHIFSEGRP